MAKKEKAVYLSRKGKGKRRKPKAVVVRGGFTTGKEKEVIATGGFINAKRPRRGKKERAITVRGGFV